MSYNYRNSMPFNNCNGGSQQHVYPSHNFNQHPSANLYQQQNNNAFGHVYHNNQFDMNPNLPPDIIHMLHQNSVQFPSGNHQIEGFTVQNNNPRRRNDSFPREVKVFDRPRRDVNIISDESNGFQNNAMHNRAARESDVHKVMKSSPLNADAEEFVPVASSSRIPSNEMPCKPPFKGICKKYNVGGQIPKKQNYPPENEKHSNLKNENNQHGLRKNVEILKSPSLVSASIKSMVAKFESNPNNDAVKTDILPSEDLISEKEKTPHFEDSKFNSQNENFDYIDIMTKDELFEFVKTLNQETRDFWGPIEILKPLENKVKKVIETIKTKFENENLIKDLESSLNLLENRAPMIESVERFDDSSEGEENSYKSTKSYKNVAEISMKALSLFRKLRLQKPTEKPEIGILKKQFIKCQTDLDSLKNDDDQLKDTLQGIHILCNEALDELK